MRHHGAMRCNRPQLAANAGSRNHLNLQGQNRRGAVLDHSRKANIIGIFMMGCAIYPLSYPPSDGRTPSTWPPDIGLFSGPARASRPNSIGSYGPGRSALINESAQLKQSPPLLAMVARASTALLSKDQTSFERGTLFAAFG
jgi:hypothetical protein